MTMQRSICRLCKEQRELCISHALPNSAFRVLLKENSGKAIFLVNDQNTPNQYSSDSWGVILLCKECEDKLNRNYDVYGIGVLRGQKCKVQRSDAGVTFTGIDRQRFRMFFLSLLWRISISHHECYGNVDLPYHWEDELYSALYQGSKVRGSMFTVAIYRLHDSTPGGFSIENLRSLITAPFGRKFDELISVCFVLLGFFVEIFIPRIPPRFSKRLGVLSGSTPIYFAPYYEIMDIPELVSLMVNGLRKHEQGLSTIG